MTEAACKHGVPTLKLCDECVAEWFYSRGGDFFGFSWYTLAAWSIRNPFYRGIR